MCNNAELLHQVNKMPGMDGTGPTGHGSYWMASWPVSSGYEPIR